MVHFYTKLACRLIRMQARDLSFYGEQILQAVNQFCLGFGSEIRVTAAFQDLDICAVFFAREAYGFTADDTVIL